MFLRNPEKYLCFLLVGAFNRRCKWAAAKFFENLRASNIAALSSNREGHCLTTDPTSTADEIFISISVRARASSTKRVEHFPSPYYLILLPPTLLDIAPIHPLCQLNDANASAAKSAIPSRDSKLDLNRGNFLRRSWYAWVPCSSMQFCQVDVAAYFVRIINYQSRNLFISYFVSNFLESPLTENAKK